MAVSEAVDAGEVDSVEESSSDDQDTLQDPTDEETSSSGSDSDDIDSDSDEEIIVREDREISAKFPAVTGSANDLKSRLATLLPQLQQANAELETDPEAIKQVDHVDDEEDQYIEMNLGLGVLKGKRQSSNGVRTTSPVDESDDSTSSSSDDGLEPVDKGIIEKLKGMKPIKRKIEEVN